MPVSPCPSPSPQPQRGVVTFDAADFKLKYPAFATVDDTLLQGDFDIATMFLNNSCCSIVRDAPTRERLLYMVTAHVAALLQGENGQAPSGMVGRVSSGAEGSVSATTEYAKDMSMSEAYFTQTKYGAMFWQATVAYRNFHYVPPPNFGCIGRGSPWGGPWPRDGNGY
jgi:Protein of unknown function (DUF4054)